MERESPFQVIARHQERVPVNLDGIAQDLGLRVKRQPLGLGWSGAIYRNSAEGGQSGFLVLVDSGESMVRQRFTLAHEIAHFILHRDLILDGVVDDAMYRSRTLSSTYESQANRLAADILMPSKKVRQLMDRGKSTAEMARAFGVSEAAMEIRRNSVRPTYRPG